MTGERGTVRPTPLLYSSSSISTQELVRKTSGASSLLLLPDAATQVCASIHPSAVCLHMCMSLSLSLYRSLQLCQACMLVRKDGVAINLSGLAGWCTPSSSNGRSTQESGSRASVPPRVPTQSSPRHPRNASSVAAVR